MTHEGKDRIVSVTVRGYNPNCDGSGGRSGHAHTLGEVRVLPTGGGGNAILCHACYVRELRWRHERNKELGEGCKFDAPAWDSLKIYGTES